MRPIFKKEMISAIQNTYEAIAGDLPQGIDLETAIELTLDADRIAMYGYDEDATNYLATLPYTAKKAIAFLALKGYF